MIATSVFSEKLRRANPRLYVDLKNTTYNTNAEFGTCGIYFRDITREQFDAADYDTELHGWVKANNACNLEYITYTNSCYVPEVSEYNEKGNVVSPGLRELVKSLHSKGFLSDKAVKKHFGASYLDTSWWDRLNHTQKKAIRLEEK